jgi:hypothetical protein
MNLYKYVTPDRADIVEHLRIRFSPPDALNDPFECLPTAKIVEDPSWMKRLENHSVASLYVEETMNAIQERRPARCTESMIRDAFRTRVPERIPALKQKAAELVTEARRVFRILCLSYTPPGTSEATLMWGHYTKNHEGMVLEFDDTNDWVSSHAWVDGEPHDAQTVAYAKSRAGWIVDPDGNARPEDSLVATKSEHWAYEQEFRLIRFAGNAGLDASGIDSLVSFPPDLLRSVTFGVNTTDATKSRIRAACARPELSHVRLRQAEIHPDEYRLVVADVSA